MTIDAQVLRRDEENGTDCSSAGFKPGIRMLIKIRVCPSCNSLDMESVATSNLVDSTAGLVSLRWNLPNLERNSAGHLDCSSFYSGRQDGVGW